jgi:putative ABC transport system permease protein
MSLAFTALIILFTYALAFVIMLIIAVLSVSVLTWKAATANPVDSLRTE